MLYIAPPLSALFCLKVVLSARNLPITFSKTDCCCSSSLINSFIIPALYTAPPVWAEFDVNETLFVQTFPFSLLYIAPPLSVAILDTNFDDTRPAISVGTPFDVFVPTNLALLYIAPPCIALLYPNNEPESVIVPSLYIAPPCSAVLKYVLVTFSFLPVSAFVSFVVTAPPIVFLLNANTAFTSLYIAPPFSVALLL